MHIRRSTARVLLAFLFAACSATPPSGPTDQPHPTGAGSAPPASAGPTGGASPSAEPPALLGALPTAQLDGATAAGLQGVLDSLVASGAPDAIGAVVTANGTWAGAAGIDGPKGRLATPTDEFSIFSVSKPILAALFLRLAQDGKVDLDAPLSTYLGDLPLDANGATVRQALAMRAGIGATPSELLDFATAHCDRVWKRTELFDSIPPPSRPPDRMFEYSNPTYKLLGYAAEEITGKSLETAFHDLLFGPLGEDRILLQGPMQATPKPWALPIAGHAGPIPVGEYGTGGTLPCVSLSTFSFSTAAVASDAPSLARWGWALFSGSLIDRERLSAMTVDVGWGDYRLGIERLRGFPALAYGTHGGGPGYAAFLVIVPGREAVATCFVNDEDAVVDDCAARLIEALEP